MLRRLVEFSLSQRLFTLLVAGLIAGFGLYAFLRIPIDAFPNIAQGQV
jgi:cobalt-zinc-cadmium resistance protein CzcA